MTIICTPDDIGEDVYNLKVVKTRLFVNNREMIAQVEYEFTANGKEFSAFSREPVVVLKKKG